MWLASPCRWRAGRYLGGPVPSGAVQERSTMMRHITRWMPVFALAAGVAAAGCTKDVNRPEDVDPQAVANGVAGLSSSFSGNLAFQSLRVLSGSFGFSAAGAVAAVSALLPPPPAGPRASSLTPRERAALLQLALRSPVGAQAIFPVDVLGKTLVWDTTLDKYVVDPLATGAPANGVRFMLYLVGDTLLHRPQEPLIVVGHVDLTDLSDARANRLGVLVQYLSQTIADYTITGTVSTTSLGLQARGYLTDGTARLDFDLRIQASLAGVEVDYALAGSNGFRAEMRIALGFGTGATTVLWRVSSGGNAVEVALSSTDSTVTGVIRFNGATVATVTGTEDEPIITGSGGHPLTAQDLEALRTIFVGFVQLMDQIDGVFGPAHLVFQF
jgi:hypothetical protein